MRQVTAVVEAQSEDDITGLQHRLIRGHVRARPGVRLHVGVLCSEQFLHSVDGNRLDLVDDCIASVLVLAWVALAVLVGQHRTRGAHHGR